MNLDFSQWGVISPNDETGFGRQARDVRAILGLSRHLVIPSGRTADRPLQPPVEILLPPEAPDEAVREGLRGLQGILFFERYNWHPRVVPLARELGVKTVCVPNWEWFRGREPGWQDCDFFVCPTDWTVKVLDSFGVRNRVRLPWCLNLASLPERRVTGPARFFVHNAGLVDFNDRKGTRDTIQAFRRVRRDDIRLLVRLQAEVPLPPLDSRIEVRVGNLENHADLYREADVALQPSKMEGIGFMVIEAVAAGMPVVTTNAPPMNEFVRQPEMRAAGRWWRPRAFHKSWGLPHVRLTLPSHADLARRIAWCADHDLAAISAQNRAWAIETFDAAKLRQLWTETLERHLFRPAA